jgi:hypothetical protein
MVTPASAAAICARLAVGWLSAAKARGDCCCRIPSAVSSAALSGSGTRTRVPRADRATSGSTSLRLSAISKLVNGSSVNGESSAQERIMLVMLPCSNPVPSAGRNWSTSRRITATWGNESLPPLSTPSARRLPR